MASKTDHVRFPGNVRVTIKPDARGYYRCRWPDRDGGTGDRRFPTLQEAEAFAWELSTAIRSDRGGAPRNGDRPVSELVEAWYDDTSHDGPLSPTYIRASRCWHNKYVVPEIGHVRAANWEPSHSRKVLAAGRDNGLAASSLNRLRRDLGSLVAVGKRLGYLAPGQDPLAGIRPDRAGSHVDLEDLPGREDIVNLANAMAQVTGVWWRGLQVHLLAMTGLRIGEALGLAVDDVSDRHIRVRRQLLQVRGPATMGEPKYGSARTVPVPAVLVAELRRMVAERGDMLPVPYAGQGQTNEGAKVPLFPSARGGWERYSTFKNQRWNPACHAAGWERGPANRGFVWTPHTLRHYFCTMALAPKPDGMGAEVADVARYAGHTSPVMTWKVYVQARPGRIERGADALDEMEWDL